MSRMTIAIREGFEAFCNGLLAVLLFLLLDNPTVLSVVGAAAIALLSIDELLIMLVARVRNLFDVAEMGFGYRMYALGVQVIRIGIVVGVIVASVWMQGRSFISNLTLGCVPFALFGIQVRIIKLLDILMSPKTEEKFRMKGPGY